MYARKVVMHLKPNARPELMKMLDSQVFPTLRKQKGFKDALVFVAPMNNEAFAISLWDTKENAEAYNGAAYPNLIKTLTPLVEGTPVVNGFEVVNTTIQKPVAATATV